MKTRLNQSRRLALSVLAVAALTAIMSGDAFAEPMKTLLSSGPSANRVDIVLLGDGYTAGQMANYASDVTANHPPDPPYSLSFTTTITRSR